jgi:protein-disulfide isomerase
MLKIATVALVAVFSLSGPQKPSDEVAALKRELEQMRAQQDALKADVEAIKSLLEGLTGRPLGASIFNASLPIAGEPSKGSKTAKVTMVEISDYHCPYCRRHMQQTQPQLDAAYVATGKLQYVFVDYPIEQLHPEAYKAHEAANCAGDQGKYWEMHNQLFASPTRDVGELEKQASAIGLDGGKFKACLEGGKYAKPVRESVARMQELGVDSTPTFLIGLTPSANQPFKVIKVLRGAMPFSQFKSVIDDVATRSQ